MYELTRKARAISDSEAGCYGRRCNACYLAHDEYKATRDKEMKELLVTLTKDEDHDVRQVARTLLAELGEEMT